MSLAADFKIWVNTVDRLTRPLCAKTGPPCDHVLTHRDVATRYLARVNTGGRKLVKMLGYPPALVAVSAVLAQLDNEHTQADPPGARVRARWPGSLLVILEPLLPEKGDDRFA
jgi:hypothetical protein